jgi:hypothetical protein
MRIILLISFALLQGFFSYSQNIVLKGVITDLSSGLPITSAHIYLKNSTKTGTVTNEDGKFF